MVTLLRFSFLCFLTAGTPSVLITPGLARTVWEEEDPGAQGGERDARPHSPRGRVRLRRRSHLRLLQRHLHRE
jgi:hypothetical protein